MIYNIF